MKYLLNYAATKAQLINLRTLMCIILGNIDLEKLQFIKYWTSLSTIHLKIVARPNIDPFDTIIETVTSLEINGFSGNCQLFVIQLSKCFPNCSQLIIDFCYITIDDLDLSTFDKLEDITIAGMETIIFPKRVKKLRLSISKNTRVVFPDSISDYCEIILEDRENEQLVDMLPIIKKALKYAIFYEKSLFDFSDNYDVVISNFGYPIWPKNNYKQIGNEFVFSSICNEDENLDYLACHGKAITSSTRKLIHDNKLNMNLRHDNGN